MKMLKSILFGATVLFITPLYSQWDEKCEESVEKYLQEENWQDLQILLDKYLVDNGDVKANEYVTKKINECGSVVMIHTLYRAYLHAMDKGSIHTDTRNTCLYLMLGLLVIAKADADYCILCGRYDAKFMQEQYALLVKHCLSRLFAHLGKERLNQVSFSKIVKGAAEYFKKITLKNLPSPLWIGLIKDASYNVIGVFSFREYLAFGNPSSWKLASYRVDWKKNLAEQMTEKGQFMGAHIARHCSIDNSWKVLLKMSGWDDFLKHDFSSFGEAKNYITSKKCSAYRSRITHHIYQEHLQLIEGGEKSGEVESDEEEDAYTKNPKNFATDFPLSKWHCGYEYFGKESKKLEEKIIEKIENLNLDDKNNEKKDEEINEEPDVD